MNTINISKAAFEVAKQAGEAEGMTFAAWRTAMKQKAKDEGVETTTVALTTETTTDIVTADVNAGAVLSAQLDDAANLPTTEQVLATVEEAIDNVNTAQAAAVVATTVSKSKLAQAIFADELAKQTATGTAMVRKDVLARFMNEAGLSKAGANTYYQNIREKAGLVTKKA